MESYAMSEYRRGADFERKVVNDYEARDWTAHRTTGSKGVYDVWAHKMGEVHIIQCKLTGRITKLAKEQLRCMAEENKFRAFIASNHKGTIVMEELTIVEVSSACG